jgi:predicted Zn finger-like uncharacterized protein
MPITLNCPKCHKPFRVRDESIGGRVRCPSCGTVLQVPAALSPGSHFGTEMTRPSIPPVGPSSTERPLAEEVPPTRMGTGPADDLMLGGTGRRDDHVDLSGHPGDPGLPAPPSIKVKGPTAPPPPPPRQARPAAPTAALPKAPPPSRARDRATQRLPLGPVGDDDAWKKVRGGLGMIRWGLLFLALILLGGFGHAVWIMLDTDNALDEGVGFLGKKEWPKWKEVLVAYTAGPAIPGILLLLGGRLRSSAAPAESHAAGLARWATLFTLLAILGAAVYVGLTYFGLWAQTGLPADMEDKARWSGLILAIPSVILADVLTLLFIGQIGWPLGRPQLQSSVAGFFGYATLMPAALLIAHLWYPVVGPMRESYERTGTPLGGQDTDVAQRALIGGVVVVTAAVLLVLRYAGVAGAGRRAIKRHLAGEA